MRRKAIWAVASCLMAGCSILGGKPAGEITVNEYVDLERHFSFRIPSGWELQTSKNPFRKPSYLARIEPAEKDAAAEANLLLLATKSCFEAVRDSLEASSFVKLRSPEPFTIASSSGEIPAWRADIEAGEGKKQGRVALFCEGGAAIVLEVSATGDAYAKREAELASIVESFSYRGGKEVVPVAPAAVKPPPIAYFIHEVKWHGQTLGQITRWYTGKYENWKKLADLNDLTVPDASLKVGRQIKIPPDLVIRQTPMTKPRAPVSRETEKGEAAPESQAAPPANEAEPASQPSPAATPVPPAAVPPPPEEPPPPLPPVIGPR